MEPFGIMTRFCINSGFFRGRVYIFPSNFQRVYGNVKEAAKHINDVIRDESPSLEVARSKLFDITNAIMWGSDKGDKMIDFFGIGSDYSLRKNWNSNPDVFSWVTKNGIIVPSTRISEITCGKGMIIMGEEERYRRTVSSDDYFLHPPKIKDLGIAYEDYSTIDGDRKLEELTKS